MGKIYELDEKYVLEIAAAGIRCWYASVFPNGPEQQEQRLWHFGKAYAYLFVLLRLNLLRSWNWNQDKTEISIIFDKELLDKVLTPDSTPEMSQKLIADIKTKMNYTEVENGASLSTNPSTAPN